MYQAIREESDRLKTPVSCYNLVIKQYNDGVNIQHNIPLCKAYQNCVYKFWYSIQIRWYVVLAFLYLIPYLNVLMLLLNIHQMVINEFAVFRFHRNRVLVPDPLQKMIYEPELCIRSTPYLYYEIDKAELKVFNFNSCIEQKILNLEKNYEGRIVRFMVYNQKFIAGYYATLEYRLSTYIHLLFSLALVFIIYYLLYSIH